MQAGDTANIITKGIPAVVDDTDLRIFRWMYPGGVWYWWGTDPRITTTEIGFGVGLERTAVWARIRRWRAIGFWHGFEVHVNPRIFGVGQVRVEVPVLGPAQGADVLDALEHVEGTLCAKVGFDISVHGREGVGLAVVIAAEDATHVRRRVRLLCGLSSTGKVEGPFREDPPACPHSFSPLDWRILAAVIANPNASPSRVARLVGVTLKTFDHHHSLLIDRHAIYYLPKVDWSKLECVGLSVVCRRAEDLDRVRGELQARYPASIPINLIGGEGIAPEWDESTCFAALVPAHSPNEVHALVRDVSRIPGVRFARTSTWGADRLYQDWVNRQVAERVAATSAAIPERAPRLGARRRISLAATSPGRPLAVH